MPRRSRNTNFLPQASSSSNDPQLDLQNVESARNAESLGRNVRRRLAPTSAENAIDFIDSVNVHSSRNGFSGIQTARTMPEECAERLIGPAHQANLGCEGQTVNQPVPSVGGWLGSAANDVTPPFHPSQLSENVLHHVSGMLRWIDILALQYQINLVLHGHEVDEGNLEESEDDVVLHGSEVEVEVDKGNLEDLEHDVGLQGPEVDEVNLEDSEDDVVVHGSEVDELDLEDWEDDVVLHGSEVDESDLEDSENDVYQGIHLDDSTHEELLAFGEDIGDAEIRLNEEAILAGVGQHSYQSPNLGSPEEEERCCICLENYVEGEELGRLYCRHEFHFNCLELWLLQKNACPLCKRAAVAI